MFKIGDTVMYGSEGVCKIIDKTREDFGTGLMEYLILEPIYKKGMTVFVHTGNEELMAKLHRILSKEEILELIHKIPEEELLHIDHESERSAAYQEVLLGGDREQIIRLIKTAHLRLKARRAQNKKPYAADERFLKEAEKILYDEFALVLEMQPEEVMPFILGEIQ